MIRQFKYIAPFPLLLILVDLKKGNIPDVQATFKIKTRNELNTAGERSNQIKRNSPIVAEVN